MSVLILPNGDAVRIEQITMIGIASDKGLASVRVELIGGRWINLACDGSDPWEVRDQLISQWREALKES